MRLILFLGIIMINETTQKITGVYEQIEYTPSIAFGTLAFIIWFAYLDREALK